MQRQLGDTNAASASYRTTADIAEMLAQRDPANTEWQRDLIGSLVKIGDMTDERKHAARALTIARAMQTNGILEPRDAWMIDALKRRAGG